MPSALSSEPHPARIVLMSAAISDDPSPSQASYKSRRHKRRNAISYTFILTPQPHTTAFIPMSNEDEKYYSSDIWSVPMERDITIKAPTVVRPTAPLAFPTFGSRTPECDDPALIPPISPPPAYELIPCALPSLALPDDLPSPYITPFYVDDHEDPSRITLRTQCTYRGPQGDFPLQASAILPGLYLSDMYTATSITALAHLGVTHVVSVLRTPHPTRVPGIHQLHVPIEDLPAADLLSHFRDAVDWIDRARETGGVVLVHCMWGMSRSAGIVIAYLMKRERWSLAQAWAHARARRGIVCPNSGFREQLSNWEGEMKGEEVVRRWRVRAGVRLLQERSEWIASRAS